MRKRDFLLLVLILLVGAALHLGQQVRRGHLPFGIQVDGLEFLEGPERTFTEDQEAPLAEGGLVEIETDRGDVEVQSWDEPRVRVEVRKQVHAETEKEGAKIAGAFHLRLEPSGGGLTAKVVADPGVERPSGFLTDLTLTLPRKARLRVSTGRGDVEVHDLDSDAVIQTSHGDVDAGNIRGACEITNRYGAVTVSGVTGKLRVLNEHDDVTVTGAEAGVEIEASRGSVTVEDTRGDVRIKSSRGEVRVEKTSGSVDVQARSSAVSIQGVAGAVTASVEADPLEITDAGGPVTVQADYTSVRLADVRGKIQVTGRHSDVTLIRPGADAEVQTTHQSIELSVPAHRGFRLDAAAEGGEIQGDFPGLRLPPEPVSRFAGTVGDGRSRFKLATSYSTIQIREEVPAPAN